MAFAFFQYSENIKNEWDTFVTNHLYGSIHQISAWKPFQQSITGREEVLGFGVKNSETNEILATTFCVRMDTGMFGKYWYYSARGPVFDPEKNMEAGQVLIKNIIQELRKTDALFWRIDPYFSPQKDRLQTDLYEGINIFPATQNYQPTDTLEINLTKSDDQILSEMKRKGRYNINLARNKGITIKAIPGNEVTEKDLGDFWNLNNETTSRDSFSGHQKSYYWNFCHKLVGDGLKPSHPYTTLFFAEAENGTRIATAINTHCGKKAIYYFGASTSDPNYRNLMAPYLLQWEMMQYAKKQGCTSYDFLGIAPENDPDHPYVGISEFKWKFGGERKVYDTGKEIVLKPFWYNLYRFAKRIRN